MFTFQHEALAAGSWVRTSRSGKNSWWEGYGLFCSHRLWLDAPTVTPVQFSGLLNHELLEKKRILFSPQIWCVAYWKQELKNLLLNGRLDSGRWVTCLLKGTHSWRGWGAGFPWFSPSVRCITSRKLSFLPTIWKSDDARFQHAWARASEWAYSPYTELASFNIAPALASYSAKAQKLSLFSNWALLLLVSPPLRKIKPHGRDGITLKKKTSHL